MNKGAAAILLTILISSVLLIIALGASSIILIQLKMSKSIEESMKAFYAADAGAEKCLFNKKNGNFPCSSGSLDNGAEYSLSNVDANSSSFTSTGIFKTVNRKIEVSW